MFVHLVLTINNFPHFQRFSRSVKTKTNNKQISVTEQFTTNNLPQGDSPQGNPPIHRRGNSPQTINHTKLKIGQFTAEAMHRRGNSSQGNSPQKQFTAINSPQKNKRQNNSPQSNSPQSNSPQTIHRKRTFKKGQFTANNSPQKSRVIHRSIRRAYVGKSI
jgi:hypothetical protein